MSASVTSTTRTAEEPDDPQLPGDEPFLDRGRHAFAYAAWMVSSWLPTRGMTTSPSPARATTSPDDLRVKETACRRRP